MIVQRLSQALALIALGLSIYLSWASFMDGVPLAGCGPYSDCDAVLQLEELGSPVKAFVQAYCVVASGHRVCTQELYEAWRCWCESDGRNLITTDSTFGRDLMAAVPSIRKRRKRHPSNWPFYEGIGLTPIAI